MPGGDKGKEEEEEEGALSDDKFPSLLTMSCLQTAFLSQNGQTADLSHQSASEALQKTVQEWLVASLAPVESQPLSSPLPSLAIPPRGLPVLVVDKGVD